jgi:tRNA nucleotidyltransferase (CCA-adding enzyme)
LFSLRKGKEARVPVHTTIAPHITEQLPSPMQAFLRSAGEYAASNGFRLLLLARPTLDPDMLVQAATPTMHDAPDHADALATALGGQVVSRSQFGTVKLQVSGFQADLVTARQETYAFPGALPDVRPATIEDDMARRDFTVNTLAADLSPDNFGSLLDLHGGGADLQQGVLRVLHDRSFQDDPTRLLRAVRYETRLGLRMSSETEAAARRDVEYLKSVSGDRIRHEFDRMFDEPQPELGLARADDIVLFQTLVPSLEWTPELTRAAQALRESGYETTPLIFLALLSLPLSQSNAETLVSRLNVPASWAKVIRDTYTLRVRLPSLSGTNILPSAVYARLSGLAPESILAWSALAPNQATRRLLLSFQMKWQSVEPYLTGDDLLALGVPQGPLIGKLLQDLLNGRLDDIIVSRDAEEEFVRSRIST